MKRQKFFMGAFCLSLLGCSYGEPPASLKRETTPSRAVDKQPRLVILGFDGIDPRRVDALVRAGRLPTLKRLSKDGYRGSLATTNPPQSPVAWAAFATGAAAGQHGIFDFVSRDPHTYLPQVATTRVTHAEVNGDQVIAAKVENLRRGDAFWDVIAQTGLSVRTITVPYAYPPVAGGARALSGLGTPDIRGTNSSFTLLTTDAMRAHADAPAGGQVALLERLGAGAWRAALEGPPLTVQGARQRPVAYVSLAASGAAALSVTVEGQQLRVELGQTSPYTSMQWVVAPQMTLRAYTRFTVRSVDPPVVYVEPLSIAPDAPYLPLASPPQYALDLWQSLGPYKTVGWLDDTAALGAGTMDEEQFLREAHATMQWTQRAVVAALKDATDRLVVAVFTSPDRIAHMFYRAVDANHPARDSSVTRYASAIDDSYIEMDRAVQAIVEVLAPQDILLVMSDHGFGSFRRGVNLNRWLISQGYLRLKGHQNVGRDFFADVDWAHSRAYAFGTGAIYLNVKGRESAGIVSPQQARPLAQRIAGGLKKLKDGRTVVVAGTFLGDVLYDGPSRPDAPDIRVALVEGYRASWATTLGGAPAPLVEDNLKKWSGDHASGLPQDLPGFLLSTRPVRVAQPRIEDLAATAYEFANVPQPPTCTGVSLLGRSTQQAAVAQPRAVP